MESKEIITKSSAETQKLAGGMAKDMLKRKSKEALVIGLEGDLGSGKTTFIQGLVQGLGIKDKITSPTFVIMKKYPFGSDASKRNFYHIDCYRIESKDLLELDFKEIIIQPENIIVIEWAERVKDILPDNVIWIRFEHMGKDKRRIIYENISFD